MKKLLSIICIAAAVLTLCGCDKKESSKDVTGLDTEVTSRLENSIELQKNLFVGEIKSVTTENALITKYNLDITEYTVYTVNITQSLDGYTPLGEAKVYCIGSVEQFPTRISMRKNETYFIDAQPWVYGDELIYLLSVYTVAYPRIDIAGNVTLETEDGELLDCGTFDEYVSSYDTALTNVKARIEGFAELTAAADRLLEVFDEIKTKNTATDFYSDSSMNFEWKPTEAFIKATADNSEKLYAEAERVALLETVTEDDIKGLFTYFK